MAFLASRQFLYGVTILFVLNSCKKDVHQTPSPVTGVEYIDLNNKEIKYKGSSALIDLNKDTKPDLIFSVLSVGDPVNQVDKRQFRVGSDIFTRLSVNSEEETPVLNKKDSIYLHDTNEFTWYEASSIILVQRTENAAGTISWQGNWKTATRNYLPVQVLGNQKRYNGWVELSVDISNEKIILHRAAISKYAEKNIMAGE